MEIGLIIGASAVLVLLMIFLATRKKSAEITPDEMDGGEFERYCADLLAANDWEIVSMTSASGDYGADILAKKDGVLYAIQCKRYQKPVGVAAVQEVAAAMAHYKCRRAAVMTNSTFTRQAKALAEENAVALWDNDTLLKLEAAKGGTAEFADIATVLVVPVIGADGEVTLFLDGKAVSSGVFADPLTLTAAAGEHLLTLKQGLRKSKLDFAIESGDRRVFAAGGGKRKPLLFEIGL